MADLLSAHITHRPDLGIDSCHLAGVYLHADPYLHRPDWVCLQTEVKFDDALNCIAMIKPLLPRGIVLQWPGYGIILTPEKSFTMR